MGEAYRLRLSHQLTAFYFFLNVIFATGEDETTNYDVNTDTTEPSWTITSALDVASSGTTLLVNANPVTEPSWTITTALDVASEGTTLLVNVNPVTECMLPKRGVTYIGSRNITHSGKTCQKWADKSPHAINSNITDDRFPDGSKEAAQNFCRNPDLKSRSGVWCYTMDAEVEWEYCDVCPGAFEGYSGCSLRHNGVTYEGKLAHTSSFMECEAWKDHPNVLFKFPDASVEEANNYCRNPDPENYDAPWCFIGGVPGATWDYCDICKPFQGQLTKEKGVYSDHGINVTDMSAPACLRWCLNMGTCAGVNVANNGSRECWFLSRFDGGIYQNDHLDYYNVQRVCSPKAGGKAAHFVRFPEVRSEPAPVDPILKLVGSETACEKQCIQLASCIMYQRFRSNETCLLHFHVYEPDPFQNDSNVVINFIIRCVPPLQPSADVAAHLTGLASQKAEPSADVASQLVDLAAKLASQKADTLKVATLLSKAGTTRLADATTGSSANDAQNKTTAPDQKKGGFPMMAIVVVGIVIIIIVAGCVGCFVCYKRGKAPDKNKGKGKDGKKGKGNAESEGKENIKSKKKKEEKKNEELQKLLPGQPRIPNIVITMKSSVSVVNDLPLKSTEKHKEKEKAKDKSKGNAKSEGKKEEKKEK